MSRMVMWARPTFLAVIPFRYMLSMPSWMNFLPASVRFLYSVYWRRDLLNCHSIAAIWGPVLFGGMMGVAPGKGGVGEGWCVNRPGSGVFCWGEYSTQVAMCTTAEGVGYSGEVAFQHRFYIVEYFVVGSSSVFDNFVGKGF